MTGFLSDLSDEIRDVCSETANTLDQLEKATADLVMYASEIDDLAAMRHEDIRQSAFGYTRVVCQWCDGEFHVPTDEPAPHTCSRCRHCDGY